MHIHQYCVLQVNKNIRVYTEVMKLWSRFKVFHISKKLNSEKASEFKEPRIVNLPPIMIMCIMMILTIMQQTKLTKQYLKTTL